MSDAVLGGVLTMLVLLGTVFFAGRRFGQHQFKPMTAQREVSAVPAASNGKPEPPPAVEMNDAATDRRVV